ncbi:BatA domain-containing protein [Lysobacter sp.]|uniref:BatA domain-containing protein n=1 Tax=Lysobacter sp. TaxID=72226 RepID=UPI002D414A3E|nr:BatA domain-containing protein [Lysobacter sp.]HZX75758.1 BatA domain-containing protein [Lysobacter sp.]
MSLAFLLPAGLAALAALLLPLLIHLARRSEQRPTAFAALRWLRQKPKPRHRIRFDEWPLLLVRLLLVALLALLLARPVLTGGESDAPYVAVAPGVDVQAARAQLDAADARWHWLAPGFPRIDEVPANGAISPTSLLRELDAGLPADVALTVFVPDVLDNADGERVRLSRRVDWRVLGAAQQRASTPTPAAPLNMSVRYDQTRASSLRYLRAAHAAWQADKPSAPLDVAEPTQPLPRSKGPLVWLVPGPVPAQVQEWVRQGGTVLLDSEAAWPDLPERAAMWRDDTGAVLVDGTAAGRGRVLQLRRALVPQAMPQLLEPSFPTRLRALFAPAPAEPKRVPSRAHAPIEGGPSFPVAPHDLQPWLVGLIALMFLLERVLATAMRRAVAP